MKVKKKCCGKCLFGVNKIVSDERKKQLLDDIESQDTHFICHEASAKREDIVCKGFYDNHSSNLIRISQRLGMIEKVE